MSQGESAVTDPSAPDQSQAGQAAKPADGTDASGIPAEAMAAGDDLDTPGPARLMLMTPTARPARTAGRKRLRASPKRPGRRLTRTARARLISPTWNSKVR